MVFAIGQEALRSESFDVRVCFKKTAGFQLEPLLEKLGQGMPFPVEFVSGGSRALWQAIKWADVVHCHNATFDIASFAWMQGKPVAMTIHNWFRHIPWTRRIFRLMAFQMAECHWYNSDFVWDTWEPDGRLPDSDKLPIVSDLPLGGIPAAERKGFLFVSRWVPKKGLETLIEAYSKARFDKLKWPLRIVGTGLLRPKIEALLREIDSTGIIDEGPVSTERRNELIRHAKWMVTPPNTLEDLGMTPIEARHAGVPCIITRDGGLPEAGGKHALICEPGDAGGLRALLEQAAGMSEEAYVRQAEASHKELLEYLKPLSVYSDRFAKLAQVGSRGW